MGDNRDRSWDSRYWGFVDRDAIMGRPIVIYWSVEATAEDYNDRSLFGTIRGIEDGTDPSFQPHALAPDAARSSLSESASVRPGTRLPFRRDTMPQCQTPI